ncbi:MAG: hypothetical protein KGJ24_07550 [Burkholderiales bacterium]|nr:hypothetical protein [Burkholderiales bacterium]MDE2566266.1 hypothetical protein [Burkholderiales bacterium]
MSTDDTKPEQPALRLRALTGDADEDTAMLAELFKALTGRDATPAELAEVRAGLESA